MPRPPEGQWQLTVTLAPPLCCFLSVKVPWLMSANSCFLFKFKQFLNGKENTTPHSVLTWSAFVITQYFAEGTSGILSHVVCSLCSDWLSLPLTPPPLCPGEDPEPQVPQSERPGEGRDAAVSERPDLQPGGLPGQYPAPPPYTWSAPPPRPRGWGLGGGEPDRTPTPKGGASTWRGALVQTPNRGPSPWRAPQKAPSVLHIDNQTN